MIMNNDDIIRRLISVPYKDVTSVYATGRKYINLSICRIVYNSLLKFGKAVFYCEFIKLAEN